MQIFIVILAVITGGCSLVGNRSTINNISIPMHITEPEYYEDLSLDDIKKLNGGTVEIIYLPDINIPKEIKGKFTNGTIKSEEDAIASLASVRTLMHINEISYVCVDIVEDEHIKSFYLQQVYNGVIVLNGTFRVIATYEGEPVAIIGIYINGIEIDTTPLVAINDAKKSVILEKGTKISETKIAVYKDDDEIVHLCWLFDIYSREPLKNKTIVVDAYTGKYIIEYPHAIS